MKNCVFSYSYTMKKFFPLSLAVFALPLFAGCGKAYDYTRDLSEVKRDIFLAETEDFSLTLSCGEREYPYASDGVACPMTSLCEISVKCKEYTGETVSVFVLGETEWGGEMSFRNVRDDFYYSSGLTEELKGPVSLRVEIGESVTEVVATSVKTEKTLSPEEALSCAVAAEKEYIKARMQGGEFAGEFRVRLLRREICYYYVGIVDSARTLSLLLDAETGEVLARRESES